MTTQSHHFTSAVYDQDTRHIVKGPRRLAMQALQDEGALLVDRVRDHCWMVNRMGTYVWHRLTNGTSIDVIVEDVATCFKAVERREIAAHIARFLEQLANAELLDRAVSVPRSAPESAPAPDGSIEHMDG